MAERYETIYAKAKKAANQAVEGLKRELAHLDNRRGKIVDYLRELGHTIGGAIHTSSKAASKTKTKIKQPSKRKGKRIRRSPEQLKQEAEAVFEMIKKAGSGGIGGGVIRRQHPGVGQDIKGFITKNTDHKIKTKGEKIKMVYIAG
jgi:predicted  nucleic acid-binding Zn-ribbon protein